MGLDAIRLDVHHQGTDLAASAQNWPLTCA